MCDLEACMLECHARTYDGHTPTFKWFAYDPFSLFFFNCVVVEATSGLKQLHVARSFESAGFLCSVIVQREV